MDPQIGSWSLFFLRVHLLLLMLLLRILSTTHRRGTAVRDIFQGLFRVREQLIRALRCRLGDSFDLQRD